MAKPTITISVSSCGLCPFFDDRPWPSCNALDGILSTTAQALGLSALVRDEAGGKRWISDMATVPSWCPLRRVAMQVRLAQGDGTR